MRVRRRIPRSAPLDYRIAAASAAVLGIDGVIFPFFTGQTLHELMGVDIPGLYSEVNRCGYGYSANEAALFGVAQLYALARRYVWR